jgi:CDP-diacylglycerol--glycerol-3-phosphate 3-phosphatidyltransferase
LTGLSEMRHRLADRLTPPAVRIISKTGLSPNGLTVIGFLISVGSAVALGMGYFVVGGVLVLVAGAFDMLDGPLARAKGRTTTFGAMLDSSLDRLSEAAVLLGILIYFLYHEGTWQIWLPYVTFVGSVMVSYLRARAEGLGLKCEVGVFTRAERVIVLAIGLVVAQWLELAVVVAMSLLAALAFVTVAQRLLRVWQLTNKESGV